MEYDSKNKNREEIILKKKVFSFFAVFCLLTSFTMSVFAIERENPNDKYPSEKEISEIANELEYIFTNIIVKNESTGKYTINQSELNNSSYTEEEKAGMIAFSDYLNDGSTSISASDGLVTAAASNTFKRCMSEALGIYGSSLDQFVEYVDKSDWVGAAGVLGFWGISVHPVTVFIFAMNCGAGKAS